MIRSQTPWGGGGDLRGQLSQLAGTRSRASPPTHHDHSDHDGRDADEVQLPREELVDPPVAVLLQGGQTASGRPSSGPTRQQPAARGGAQPRPRGPQKRRGGHLVSGQCEQRAC